MPQFLTGESRTARAMMRNPTGKPFDYRAFVYLGTELAVAAERSFSLAAGEERQEAFPLVVPSVPGTYPVHLGVFSGGRSIALYRATEDVTAIRPPAFAYGDLGLTWAVVPEAPLLRRATIRAAITNPSAMSVRHTLTLWMGVIYGGSLPDEDHFRIEESWELELAPNESRPYLRESIYVATYNATQYYYWTFEDGAGNRSPRIRG